MIHILKNTLRHTILYGGFLFVIYMVVQSTNAPLLKVFLVLVMTAVLIVNILFDTLKHLYKRCQIALVVDCDLTKVKQLSKTIEKYDFLKGMKPSLILTDTLVALDSNDPQRVIQLIETNEKFFSGHPDYLLIKYHSLFKAYALLDDLAQTRHFYQEVLRFKQTGKKKSVSQLFNWQEIDAIMYRMEGKYKKSFQAFQAVDLKVLNNRECIHHYYERALLEIQMKQKSNIKGYIKNIEGLNPSSPFIGVIYEAI